jgi:EpsI family protein
MITKPESKSSIGLARALLMALAMVTVSIGATFLRPTTLLADQLPPLVLAKDVPEEFGGWRSIAQPSNQIVNPQTDAFIKSIYSETLSRTYVDNKGHAVMLSIAYGRKQQGDGTMHYPDVCYPAQGYSIGLTHNEALTINGRLIYVRRLHAKSNQRSEPLTYWTTIGDEVPRSAFLSRLIKLRYATRGLIPDGALVRISSINTDAESAWREQTQFMSDFLNALHPDIAARLAGLANTEH